MNFKYIYSILNPAVWLATATRRSQARRNGEGWGKQWQTTPLFNAEIFYGSKSNALKYGAGRWDPWAGKHLTSDQGRARTDFE